MEFAVTDSCQVLPTAQSFHAGPRGQLRGRGGTGVPIMNEDPSRLDRNPHNPQKSEG